ncbi:helix-turn-helix domain-containing protein [Patulibacter sp. NPDC049589]|uniref:TetR/AcrR family transcriptional regulator n=1 Tax=Patulibacter sp. NPDC049589 TaxID=3154731 RepID=UPI00341F83C5
MSAARPSLRADARRNRDAVLVAAREVFAEQGLDAPLDAVARRAGVGRATLYRSFPTREDLVRASFDDNLEALEALVAEHADPDRAFEALLRTTAELQLRDLGFIELLARRGPDDAITHDIVERFLAVLREPLRQAQAAGLVRADVAEDDAMLVVEMLGAAARGGAGRNDRALALLLDALAP